MENTTNETGKNGNTENGNTGGTKAGFNEKIKTKASDAGGWLNRNKGKIGLLFAGVAAGALGSRGYDKYQEGRRV